MKPTITLLVIASLVFIPRQQQAQPPERAKPQLIAECGVAVVVLVVGAIVVVNLKKLCDKIPKSDSNPPPPPPAQPSTNSQSSASFVPSGTTVAFADDAVGYFNISGYGLTNNLSGAAYTCMFSLNLQSSTNLVAWTPECSVTGWVSSTATVAVFYNNGVPSSTNWCNFNSPTLVGSTATGNAPPQKFFRFIQ